MVFDAEGNLFAVEVDDELTRNRKRFVDDKGAERAGALNLSHYAFDPTSRTFAFVVNDSGHLVVVGDRVEGPFDQVRNLRFTAPGHLTFVSVVGDKLRFHEIDA